MTRLIVSSSVIRTPSSSYVRERYGLIQAMISLGLIHDVKMGAIVCCEGSTRWKLYIKSEVSTDD